MDLLIEHEAFLRAIFDAADDDTPRLVYADFLEEQGEADRAALIRTQCMLFRLAPEDPRRAELAEQEAALLRTLGEQQPHLGQPGYSRGFCDAGSVMLSTRDLADPTALRRRVVSECPAWFGASSLMITPGRPLNPEDVSTLFALPFIQQVTDWQLGGQFEEVSAGPLTEDHGTYGLKDLNHWPAMTVESVETLAQHRGARRITSLVLTYNNLDNDAARAIIRSPYLVNLKRLDLKDGNLLRGRTWQQLLERFGPDVVG